eukprot:3058994-Pyramimonas_sp.AAC.1
MLEGLGTPEARAGPSATPVPDDLWPGCGSPPPGPHGHGCSRAGRAERLLAARGIVWAPRSGR